MDCKAIEEQLSEYLDGRLSEGERREIAAHLDACPACREGLEELQKVVDLVGELPYLTAPEGLHERILRQNLKVVPGEQKPFALPPRYSRWLPMMRGVAAAAVLMLFAFLGHELIDTGPVTPESEMVGAEAPPCDPESPREEGLVLKDAEDETAGGEERLGKALQNGARRKLKTESEKAGGRKKLDKAVEDTLDKAAPAQAERKYREKRKEGAREAEPSRDEWEEEAEADAEGAADRRAPVKEGKDSGESPAARKGRTAGKAAVPGAPAKEPAPGGESKTKKGVAPEASKKSAEPGTARSRGRGASSDEPKAEKKRAGWSPPPGGAAPPARRAHADAKAKGVPVTLLVFTPDPAKALARIEADLSGLKGQKGSLNRTAEALEESAKKLERRAKAGEAGEKHEAEDAPPPPGGGGGAVPAEDAPRSGRPAPAPSARPEGERAFGAEKESGDEERKKAEGEADDSGRDEDAGPEGGPAREDEKKVRQEQLRRGLAGLRKDGEVVKVLRLTLTEYQALKRKMAEREETSRFREQPTNLYRSLQKKRLALRAQAKSGFSAGPDGEASPLIEVTLRFEAPPEAKPKTEGAEEPAPSPTPSPQPPAKPGEKKEEGEKPEEKE